MDDAAYLDDSHGIPCIHLVKFFIDSEVTGYRDLLELLEVKERPEEARGYG